MTPDDGQDSQPDHRFSRDVPAGAIEYRQPDDEDGVFEVRMPIATTGEVRNEGDDPLSRDELSGMARQIDDRNVSVFLDHGRSPIGGRERYSATEKVGEWQDADVGEREADDTNELVATARLMDPETLPSAAGMLRESLASIKEQVKRDMSLASSIGWRDDEDFPGGVDLMEASIVGIGADPRTTSDAEAAVVARAAVEAGADPNRLLASVRSAVASDRPLGPPNDPDRFDTFEECVNALMEDEDIDREAAERICGSWEAAKDENTNHDMTDEDDTPDEQSGDEQEAPDEQPDETQDEAAEFREQMLELQEAQMETLEAISEAVREDDDEDEDDGGENETDEDEDEEDDENAADEADEQSAGDEDEERDLEAEVSDLREQLDDLRDGGIDADDVDTPDPDDEQGPDDEQESDDKHELTNKYQIK